MLPAAWHLLRIKFKRFVENDFGYEDRFFLIGHSDVKKDWPYILAGTG